jgi:hypothetical protein
MSGNIRENAKTIVIEYLINNVVPINYEYPADYNVDRKINLLSDAVTGRFLMW